MDNRVRNKEERGKGEGWWLINLCIASPGFGVMGFDVPIEAREKIRTRADDTHFSLCFDKIVSVVRVAKVRWWARNDIPLFFKELYKIFVQILRCAMISWLLSHLK